MNEACYRDQFRSLRPSARPSVFIDVSFKDVETDDEAQRIWDSSKTKAKTIEAIQPKTRKGTVNMAEGVNQTSFVAL